MPRLIVSIDGVVVKEVLLNKSRITLGRRPHNDLVLDQLAVSGEHAVIVSEEGKVTLEDLGSTNGTYVNGDPIVRRVLVGGDEIDIGKCRLQYLDETASSDLGFTAGRLAPRVKVLSGTAAGRELLLTKTLTTIGKPGVSVASITRRTYGFELAQLDGAEVPSVNGVTLDGGPIILKNNDVISVGGVRLEFVDP
ncbi:FHA domain-containing protein [Ottowia thiooxydans]|uniref:FHA domain-containing protein n=1 Tax=Ottowia thiooxydans TaxID=219182 RepID=UPI00048DEC92|nr:FHA domain-containing protein [Ottowia thiooxydans]